MTIAERKRLLKRLMKAAEQRGWKGGVDDSKAAKFLKWTEDTKTPFVDEDGDDIDIKALVVEQPDSRTVVVTEVDDEEPADVLEMDEEEEDEEEPKRVNRSARELANTVKKMKAQMDLLKQEIKRRPGTPAVKVKTVEEIRYDISVKRGDNVFSDFTLAKGWAYQLQSEVRRINGDLTGAQKSREELLKFMDRSGMDTKAYVEGAIGTGGAFVFDEFLPDLIHLVDEHGMARSLSNVVTMNSDQIKRPRKTGILDIYYPGEGGTATEASLPSDLVTLTAKKGLGYTLVSSEILEDALIDLANEAAKDIARGIAFVEDNTWVNGDGTQGSTGDRKIPNVLGYLAKFGDTAPSTSDSRSVEGGTTALTHTLAHLYTTVSLLPTYAINQSPVWICSPQIDAVVFQRLAGSVGGMTRAEFAGRPVNAFLGYPIVHMDTMPKSVDAGADRVDILFGVPNLSVMMGLRKDVEIVSSDQKYFDTDQIAIRGRVRHDINIHDVGSATDSSPVVALYQT